MNQAITSDNEERNYRILVIILSNIKTKLACGRNVPMRSQQTIDPYMARQLKLVFWLYLNGTLIKADLKLMMSL